MPEPYVARLIDPVLDDLLQNLPAVLIVGPRAAGKTTTARRRAASVLRLDRRAEADVARADADAVLTAYDEPILIDEWQLVPDVLGAVKRSVDEDSRPGRFLLTGSAGADLTVAGWPATGRVVRVPLWGLVQRELVGDSAAPGFIDRLLEDGAAGQAWRGPLTDVRGYVELALRGGFPEVARQPSARARRVWLASYVDQLVTRDIGAAGERRDPTRLRRYLQAVAANTAGVVEHKTLYDAAGVNRLTGLAYDGALQTLFVTEHVPAWAASRLGRLVRSPKRYLTEPALLGPLVGLDERSVLRDGDLLGRVLDTFVAAQLRAELIASESAPRLFHLREAHGRHEVDLLVETADGRVLAFEVKASATVGADATSHLRWLRDRLGPRFVAGVVLYTGPGPIRLDDRIVALPIASIWT